MASDTPITDKMKWHVPDGPSCVSEYVVSDLECVARQLAEALKHLDKKVPLLREEWIVTHNALAAFRALEEKYK